MPGPNRAPRGGYAKPKNMGRTIRRLAGYLTRSKLPLLMVLLFLVLSVGTNLGGSYMMRSIINNFIWSGCTDFAGRLRPYWSWWWSMWQAAPPPMGSPP